MLRSKSATSFSDDAILTTLLTTFFTTYGFITFITVVF